MKNYFDNIKVIALDVDGTITDGNFYVNEKGEVSKGFNTRDMSAVYKASKDGYIIVFVTGSTDKVIHAKTKDCFTIISGSHDKLTDMNYFLGVRNLDWDNVAYIGDSENDLACIEKARYTGCPASAIPEVKAASDFCCEEVGGSGAVYSFIRRLYNLKNVAWL